MAEPDEEPVRVTLGLFIGSLEAASNFACLRSFGITHILTVAKELPQEWPSEFRHLHIPLTDEDKDDEDCQLLDSLISITTFVDAARYASRNVLVHDLTSNSRAVAVVCLYLMYSDHRMSAEAALDYIAELWSLTSPSGSLVRQLRRYETLLKGAAPQPTAAAASPKMATAAPPAATCAVVPAAAPAVAAVPQTTAPPASAVQQGPAAVPAEKPVQPSLQRPPSTASAISRAAPASEISRHRSAPVCCSKEGRRPSGGSDAARARCVAVGGSAGVPTGWRTAPKLSFSDGDRGSERQNDSRQLLAEAAPHASTSRSRPPRSFARNFVSTSTFRTQPPRTVPPPKFVRPQLATHDAGRSADSEHRWALSHRPAPLSRRTPPSPPPTAAFGARRGGERPRTTAVGRAPPPLPQAQDRQRAHDAWTDALASSVSLQLGEAQGSDRPLRPYHAWRIAEETEQEVRGLDPPRHTVA